MPEPLGHVHFVIFYNRGGRTAQESGTDFYYFFLLHRQMRLFSEDVAKKSSYPIDLGPGHLVILAKPEDMEPMIDESACAF